MLKNKFSIGEEVCAKYSDSHASKRWIVSGLKLVHRVGEDPKILYTICLRGTTEDNREANTCPFYFHEDELVSMEKN